MSKQKVIVIFDIGKTNKKICLFNEHYQLLKEVNETFAEIKDEDDFPCEDIDTLSKWVWQKFNDISLSKEFEITGINISAYGASMMHLNDYLRPITPLYNYLKPFPENLKKKFYEKYGGESLLAKQTASPVLGSLNSGLQLYRLKYERAKIYNQIKFSLHLPQYLSFIISSRTVCDITSVGCHTHLWDFKKNKYHNWVYEEEMRTKFPPIYRGDKTISLLNDSRKIRIGTGLHDSSAALIPYLKSFTEPFVLLSTGTWCISLNPFNHNLLTDDELKQDCLCYLSYHGKPVKAARLFAGYEHEEQVKRIAEHFNVHKDFYKIILYDSALVNKLDKDPVNNHTNIESEITGNSLFKSRPLNDFTNFAEAYHQLIYDLVIKQSYSTKLVMNNAPVKNVYVDGGFGKNDIYMHLLASAFPDLNIFAAAVPHASALGAAIAVHNNQDNISAIENLIELKHFKPNEEKAF